MQTTLPLHTPSSSSSPTTTPTTATPTSPSRPSRLRGLSYLRNYTRDHLSSNSTSSFSRAEPAPQPRRAASQERTDGGAVGRDIQPVPPPASTLLVGKERRSRRSTEGDLGGLVPSTRRGVQFDETATELGTENGMTRVTPISTTSSTSRIADASGSSNNAATTSTTPATTKDVSPQQQQQPSIRFIPHTESRSSRPSLHFPAITRSLPTSTSVVRVGRYSERDTPPPTTNNVTSSVVPPVGFKSKVVSRRHCEFTHSNNQWYVRDVRSSSGTFLNHVRLSAPGTESRLFPVRDGDVVQLGIDFKGGEEVIFRCVRMRVECNRGWQKGLNVFNTEAHERLFKATGIGGASTSSPAPAASTSAAAGSSKARDSSECAICLNPVAPCQALFVAPCSHVWHYKCIRGLLEQPGRGGSGFGRPMFLCPNCRGVADLDADVEAPEDWERGGAGVEEDEGREEDDVEGEGEEEDELLPRVTRDEENAVTPAADEEEEDGNLFALNAASSSSSARPIDIPGPRNSHDRHSRGHEDESEDDDGEDMDRGRKADAEHEDRLSPRSATPTSSAQFALAAGIGEMGRMG